MCNPFPRIFFFRNPFPIKNFSFYFILGEMDCGPFSRVLKRNLESVLFWDVLFGFSANVKSVLGDSFLFINFYFILL